MTVNSYPISASIFLRATEEDPNIICKINTYNSLDIHTVAIIYKVHKWIDKHQ